MPLVTETVSTGGLVPTINIAAFIEDSSSIEAEKVVQAVRSACLTTGFFQITGHGVPSELQDATFDAAAAFFARPVEHKKKIDIHKSVGHRGYDMMGTQKYGDDLLPDMKEGFFMGHDMDPSDDRVKAGRFFMGPNLWPDTTLPGSLAFKYIVESYYAAMNTLNSTILALIARSLPYGPAIFDNFQSNSPAAPLRLLHYPPQPETTVSDGKQFGASAHTDFGAITLLLQDGTPGLEVQDPRNGDQWVGVPPQRDAYVVNIGDMLSMWTKGEYKSSMHRVLNVGGKDRYSIVYFFDGNLDQKLDPLDGSQSQGKSITVEEHMIKRMIESYGPGKG